MWQKSKRNTRKMIEREVGGWGWWIECQGRGEEKIQQPQQVKEEIEE